MIFLSHAAPAPVRRLLVDAVYEGSGADVVDVLLDSAGASPSLLNGGLFQAEVLPALCVGVLIGGAIEEADIASRRQLGAEWNEYPAGRQSGNLGFDPLNIYGPLDGEAKLQMHERELTNGRIAMVAITAYVATEFFGETTVVRATPALFEPVIFAPWFRAIMDASFGIASMDGSIDGVAF